MTPSQPIRTCEYCEVSYPHLTLTAPAWQSVRNHMGGGGLLCIAEIRYWTGCTAEEAESFLCHAIDCLFSWPFDAEASQALALIDQTFLDTMRPKHFTNHTCCEECKELDDHLLAFSLRSFRARDYEYCDPLPLILPEAIVYLVPFLARCMLRTNVWRTVQFSHNCNRLIRDLHDERFQLNPEQIHAIKNLIDCFGNNIDKGEVCP